MEKELKTFRYKSCSSNKKEVRKEVKSVFKERKIVAIERSYKAAKYTMWLIWYE